MAYVRRRGSQLAIVRGEREPGTGKVQQQILFTIYSKPEALAILGRGEPGEAERFRSLLSHRYPGEKLAWPAIRKAIAAGLDVLPDHYEYAAGRLRGRFRDDLCTFARQLVLTDPQDLATSAEVIRAHRHELAYLADLIQWRLRLADEKDHTDNRWTADDRFGWRFATRGYGGTVPPDDEETAAGFYERGEYERATAIFQLFVDTFDGYAEGYNYLGLIALARHDLELAIRHFEKTVEVGRRMFPARLAKKHYWRELDTRPYMRGLRNLALAFNEAGRYDEAKAICTRLASECGDELSADWHRTTIALNEGNWTAAAASAQRLTGLYPEADFFVAFAELELGHLDRVVAAFLHAALNEPLAARLFLGEKLRAVKSADDARDHNAGVALWRALHAYRARQSRRSKLYLRKLVRDARIARLLDEVLTVRARWAATRSDDRTDFDRLRHLQSRELAATMAHELRDLVPGART